MQGIFPEQHKRQTHTLIPDTCRAQHVSSKVSPCSSLGFARMCHQSESLQVLPSFTYPPPSPRPHALRSPHRHTRRQVTLGICCFPRHNLRVIHNHLSDGILSGPTQGQYHRQASQASPGPGAARGGCRQHFHPRLWK